MRLIAIKVTRKKDLRGRSWDSSICILNTPKVFVIKCMSYVYITLCRITNKLFRFAHKLILFIYYSNIFSIHSFLFENVSNL